MFRVRVHITNQSGYFELKTGRFPQTEVNLYWVQIQKKDMQQREENSAHKVQESDSGLSINFLVHSCFLPTSHPLPMQQLQAEM